MQWNNLIPLIGNALESEDLLGEKGSLFLVGDAKQAIYRWRGGKAEQFLNMLNIETNPFVIPPNVKNLPSNYRSHEEIINFNNEFFTITSPFLTNQTYETLFKEGNKQLLNTKKGGIVQNREGVLLANFLTQENIPVLSSESLLLKSSDKIKFLINLIQYYGQSKNQETGYELLSFLASKEKNQHTFIATHLDNISVLLLKNYDFEVHQIKQLSVYDAMEYAIKQFDLATASDAYINHFMDTVLDVEQKDGTSIQTFLAFWEKKKDKLSIAAPSSIDTRY